MRPSYWLLVLPAESCPKKLFAEIEFPATVWCGKSRSRILVETGLIRSAGMMLPANGCPVERVANRAGDAAQIAGAIAVRRHDRRDLAQRAIPQALRTRRRRTSDCE